jgi:predicted small lipoprotein YifL
MKPIVLMAIAALLGLAGCESADQQLAAQGEVQLPGARAGMKAPLTTPPDEWAGPPRADSRNGPRQESEAAAR